MSGLELRRGTQDEATQGAQQLGIYGFHGWFHVGHSVGAIVGFFVHFHILGRGCLKW